MTAGLFGYWTPRLILPALLSFYLAEFLFIDDKIVRGARAIRGQFCSWSSSNAGFEAVMLT